MKLFDKRSREEAEAESGIRIQMLKNKAQQYASKCDAIAATYDKKRLTQPRYTTSRFSKSSRRNPIP